MDFFNMIRNKLTGKKEELDDSDDPGYQTTSLAQQPHLEIFTDISNEHRSSYDYSMTEKLWRIARKGREVMFSCYLQYANCLVVITQEEIDKMALSYQFQHKQANISYELYLYTGKSFLDWHLDQFEKPSAILLDSTHIVHVTVLQQQSMIITFGFNSIGQLSLYCYSIKYDSPFSIESVVEEVDPGELEISVECAKTYVIKENQFSKLTTRVTGETQEDGRLAVVFSDFSDRPRPNLLFIWQIVPKVALLKYIDLRTVYQSMRGVVSGLCFWNGKQDLILVSTTAQLFHLSLVNDEFSKNYLNLKKKHIFLEKEEESISVIKISPRYLRDMKEAIYGVRECGNLFLIPDLADWRSQPVRMLSLTEKLPVEDFKVHCYEVSHYSKQLFLLGQNNYLYIYELAHQRFTNAVRVPHDNDEVDENWSVHMHANWYGTEVYIICNDYLYIIDSPVASTNLKQMARTVVLKNYSEEVLINLNLSKSILGFLFNKYAM